MPFNDIACHVWAIDGYRDDTAAAAANGRYVDAANLLKVKNNLMDRNRALDHLVTHTRGSQVTTKQIVIYGGFRRNQNAPEHMWMEYDGKIYETMPGYALHTADATADTRACPPLENDPFDKEGVAQVVTFLTEYQRDFIAAEALISLAGKS